MGILDRIDDLIPNVWVTLSCLVRFSREVGVVSVNEIKDLHDVDPTY